MNLPQIVLVCVAVIWMDKTYAVQVVNCPTTSSDPFGQYYISDTVDRGLYYYCLGSTLLGAFRCRAGTSTVPNTHRPIDVCVVAQNPNVFTTPAPTTPVATTTTTTTLAPTSAPLRVLVGMHIRGGTRQPTINDLATCQAMCSRIPTCFGIDWNILDPSCWFHTGATICGTVINKAGCTHYRYRNCATTVRSGFIPTTIGFQSTTPSPVFETLTGMHIRGGLLQRNINNKDTCIVDCVANPFCIGVDFDTTNNINTCYFHTSVTECNAVIPKAGCTHYRLSLICLSTTATTTAPSTTKLAACVPSMGMKIDGGVDTAFTDEAGCSQGCSTTITCFAYSFDTTGNLCKFHDASVACPPTSLVADAMFNFCNFGSCAAAAGGGGSTSAIQNGMHALGGAHQPAYRDINSCITACTQAAASVCVAIDFDNTLRGCFFHTSATCGAREAKGGCQHSVVKTCT